MSKIQVTCPECQVRLALMPPAPGKKIRCPRCEAIFAPPRRATTDAETGPSRLDRPRRRRPPPKKQGIPTGAALATIAASVAVLVSVAVAIVMHSKPGRSGDGEGPRAVGGPRIVGGSSIAESSPGPRMGRTAPEIEGEDIDGIPFKLSDYRGKVVVLDFWGHW